MFHFPWISIMVFLPLMGALLLIPIPKSWNMSAQYSKWVAFIFSSMTLAVSLYIAYHFDSTQGAFQLVEEYTWLKYWNIPYYVGIDGISLVFILLSTLLSLLSILISWESITRYVKEFMIYFLLLETFILGVFCVLDSILFYIFFEGTLIPMFLIIGIWGGKNRIYSAYKFFLYTLWGSLFMLLALLYLFKVTGLTSIPDILLHTFAPNVQKWLWLAFFLSFAVKIPMWPFHTWLPDTHVEAPTGGSVLLAGVLLKMGGYGFLRFSLPLLPDATIYFSPFVIALSLIAIVYTSLVALVQNDIKKLIAYSSIAHMGFVTLGLFSLTVEGVSGAIFQMLSHGLISGAIFLSIGMIYERFHTRDINAFGGLAKTMPKYAFCLMIFTLGSIGLPGTTGFIGEFLVLLGAFHKNAYVGAIAATGMVFGATYALLFYQKISFGASVSTPKAQEPSDLNYREIVILLPLVCAIIFWGIYPKPLLTFLEPTIQKILLPYTLKQDPKYLPTHMEENILQYEKNRIIRNNLSSPFPCNCPPPCPSNCNKSNK